MVDADVVEDEEEEEEEEEELEVDEEGFRTVNEVLKYSRSCVILPAFTVHTCTQHL